MQSGCDVFGCPMNALHVLEEANDLRNRLSERIVEFLCDRGDLRSDLGSNVALDKIVNLVEANEFAYRLLSEIDGWVNQELLCQLDNGAIRPADMFTGAARSPETRNDLDDEIDLVRQQRIEIDEPVASQFREANVGGQPYVLGESATVVVKQLTE